MDINLDDNLWEKGETFAAQALSDHFMAMLAKHDVCPEEAIVALSMALAKHLAQHARGKSDEQLCDELDEVLEATGELARTWHWLRYR